MNDKKSILLSKFRLLCLLFTLQCIRPVKVVDYGAKAITFYTNTTTNSTFLKRRKKKQFHYNYHNVFSVKIFIPRTISSQTAISSILSYTQKREGECEYSYFVSYSLMLVAFLSIHAYLYWSCYCFCHYCLLKMKRVRTYVRRYPHKNFKLSRAAKNCVFKFTSTMCVSVSVTWR